MINIKSDSRKVKTNDIFVALRGISSDGHHYIDQAIKKGASKIIAEEGEYEVETEIVPNTREYLEEYLVKNYNHYLEKMTIVGITGTNGKSTSAFFLYSILNNLGVKCGYIGTLGFYLEKKVCNLPNTSPEITDQYDMMIEAYEKGYRHMVIEVSSQGLEYRRLEGISFDYVAFTNLTQDHLDFHKTMGNYALAKQKLFYKLKENGKAIVNYDDQYKDYFLLNQNNNLTYGFTGGDYQVIDSKKEKCSVEFTYKYLSHTFDITAPIIGEYNIYNLMIAIVILDQLGIKEQYVKEAIAKLKTPPGRLDIVHYKNNSIIIDYAHTADAFNKIIETMKEITPGNVYAVFGCTGDRDRFKRPIMTKLVTDLCQYAIITIDDPHDEDPNYIIDDMIDGLENDNYEICLDRKEAIIKGIDLLMDNDALLILGKGHEEFIIYGKERIPFNDKQVALEYIVNKGE